MSKTNYLENKLIDHEFGGTTYTPPGTVYIALFTAAPGETGGGTECPGTGYTRKPVTNSSAGWTPSSASAGQKANLNEISWSVGAGDWGTITHWAIFDASTAGNMLRYAAVTTSRSPLNGSVIAFAAGAIVITED